MPRNWLLNRNFTGRNKTIDVSWYARSRPIDQLWKIMSAAVRKLADNDQPLLGLVIEGTLDRGYRYPR